MQLNNYLSNVAYFVVFEMISQAALQGIWDRCCSWLITGLVPPPLQQLPVGQVLLIHKVSRSHTMMHHSW